MVIPGYSLERIRAILAEPKSIESDVEWTHTGTRTRQKLEATTRSEAHDLNLRVTGNFNGTRWSYCLMLGEHQILRWCTTRGHTNPGGEEIVGPHIHSYDRTHGDFRAHQPLGFISANPKEDFRSFLEQCNITLNGGYEALPS